MNEPAPLPPAPPPWTLEYHLRFVPALIVARFGPEPSRTGFGPHLNLAVPIPIIVCLTLLGSGVVLLVDEGVTAGRVIATALGGGGLVAMLAMSILDQRGEPISYARFDPAMFFFTVALGATIGVFAVRIGGREFAASMAWGLVLGTTLLGYLLGLVVGYWWQALGVVGKLLAVLAYPAIIGLIVTDLVLLSG